MTPERGDILHLQFDPASAKEMRGDHFCLVVSPKAFNERFRLAMVCPISGGSATVARDTGFLISLMGFGLKTDGCVHVHQLKSLDWTTRKAQRVEKAPDEIVQQILDCLMSVFEDK
ncbi:MAG: type II toxin-antitoxin system PemK/MazF family toxin [Gallionellaceae bacterium]